MYTKDFCWIVEQSAAVNFSRHRLFTKNSTSIMFGMRTSVIRVASRHVTATTGRRTAATVTAAKEASSSYQTTLLAAGGLAVAVSIVSTADWGLVSHPDVVLAVGSHI